MTEASVTLGRVYHQLRLQLRAGGIETADLDARLLVMAAANVTSADILARPEQPLAPDVLSRLADMTARRLRFEPVSRIAGEREFHGRPFFITPETLDPRPDTELLVETVLDYVQAYCLQACGPDAAPIRIADIGTGTGCILLTLLAELRHATGVGLDVSADALGVAHRNAWRHNLSDRATFELRDVADGLENVFGGVFDIIVSNPPYISRGDIAGLAPDVRLYDPLAALDGGHDGLDFYRLFAEGLSAGRPRGFMALEVGFGQSAAVQDIFRMRLGSGRIRDMYVRHDLSGHPRCVAIALHGS